MRRIHFPPMKGFVVIQQPFTAKGHTINPGIGQCFMRPKDATEAPGHWTFWKFELGEWYEIGGIWYPRWGEAKAYDYCPVVTLKINRSKKKRGWVKKKMAEMAVKLIGTPDFYCTDRNIVLHSSDLNDKVVLAPDMETAILYGTRIKGEQCMQNSQSFRFRSLDLET